MKDRPYLRAALQIALATALAYLGARFGIPIPPPQFPTPDQKEIPEVPPPKPKPAIRDAIGRIQFGNSGCTATVVDPARPDGRYWVLTAAHCVSRVGETGTFTMKNGNRRNVTVAAINRTADCAWLLTDHTNEVLPFGSLAEDIPSDGAEVWHAGYGVDRPGNTETGVVTMPDTGSGKTEFVLSVSSGDSGGCIVLSRDDRIISCVCCTTGRGQRVKMYGSTISNIRRLRESLTAEPLWVPMDIPIVPEIPPRSKESD